MQTVLVIDTQPPHIATQALERLGALLLVVNDLARARHVLRNVPLDLWICDLSLEDLNFRSLHADSRTLNPKARILLTGPPVTKMHATTLIKNEMADLYLPKPWQDADFVRGVQQLLRQGAEAAPKKMVVTKPAQKMVLAKPKQKVVKTKPQVAPKRLIKSREPQLMIRTRSSAAAAAVVASDSRYRLEELIGEGGMGRIYRAHDTLLDMEVAVKLLTYEFSKDEDAVATLKAETRLCLQLQHKHIVRVYNLEKRQELFMIIMEYVNGLSLYQYLRQMPRGLPPEMVAQIVMVISEALSYAHGKGVLHKDISPGNVIISHDGVLKLIDFGIADRINRQRLASEYIMGTPVYMSPEQLRGEELDVRSDIYSLGVLTYQILTGRLVSSEEASFEELTSVPHAALSDLPPATHQVLEMATAFERDYRWHSIAGFAAAFQEAWQRDHDSGAWEALAIARGGAATDDEVAAVTADYADESGETDMEEQDEAAEYEQEEYEAEEYEQEEYEQEEYVEEEYGEEGYAQEHLAADEGEVAAAEAYAADSAAAEYAPAPAAADLAAGVEVEAAASEPETGRVEGSLL